MKKCEPCNVMCEMDSYVCPMCGGQDWLPMGEMKSEVEVVEEKSEPVEASESEIQLPKRGRKGK